MRQAVIFDLDGVITDTARFHFQAWKWLAEQEGLSIDEQFNEKLKGLDRMKSLDLILATGSKRFTDSEKHVLADKKNEYYKQLISGMNQSDLLPGAFDVLQAVRALGVKTALASVSKNAGVILEKLEISRLFDYVVDAERIVRTKPDPEIFLTAAKELKVAPERCIGVEDAVVGVQAIKSADMYAIGVGCRDVLSQADLIIDDLTAFPLGAAYKAIA
jgi:beta-phosphoglucomutase